jgi:NADH:ubiquinone oxidoreductase subunit C
MINKRIFLYNFKNQVLESKFIISKLYQYKIGLNIENQNKQVKISEILHLSHHQKGDIGILNFFKIFMLHLKVDLINRFKIFDESLVEDNRSNFKISYCIRSLINQGKRLVIGLYKAERSKVVDDSVPSLTSIYNSANWLERENFDLFGLKFKNNHDLRRILTDYGFVGAPFKKDFPLIGYKELSYNSENGSVTYKKISLLQEYRNFEMINPWIKS